MSKRVLGGVAFMGLVAAVVAVFGGCALFGPGKPATRVVNCTIEAVAQAVVPNLGRVNAVIGDAGLSGEMVGRQLGAIASDVGLDVVACILRDQGLKFANSASADPADVQSRLASERAASWLQAERVVFEDK